MKTTTISILRTNIKSYIDGVIGTNEPLLVNKGDNGVVIISLAEYNRFTAATQIALPVKKNDYYLNVDIDEL